MSSSFTHLLIHIIFSTKHRQPSLAKPLRDRLHAYMGGIVLHERGSVLAIGGVEDHVHLLIRLRPDQCVSDLVRLIKCNSARWANQLPEEPNGLVWQAGYSAFSVSLSQANRLVRYIQEQEEHHRHVSFREEYEAFLKRHGMTPPPWSNMDEAEGDEAE